MAGRPQPGVAVEQRVAAQHLDLDAVVGLGLGVGRDLEHVLLAARDLDVAGDRVLAVAAHELGQALPHAQRAGRDAELGELAPVAPDAAEVDAARRRAELVLLHHGDAGAALAQPERGGAADQSAADDDDIGLDGAHIDAALELSSTAASAPARMPKGLTGAWPRRRPTSATSQPRACGEDLGGSGAADAALAAAHADAGVGLGAVELGRVERTALAYLAGGDDLAAADHGLVRQRAGQMEGHGQRPLQRVAEAHDAPQLRPEPRPLPTVDGDAVIGEPGERSEPPAQLRRVGARDPGPVAREIDRAVPRAAVAVGLGQPLLRQRVERHLAAGELGELDFGLDAVADAEPGAGDAVLSTAPVAVAHGLQRPLALGRDRDDAAPHRDPRRAWPGHVPEPLGEGAPAPQQARQHRKRVGGAGGIQNGRHARAGVGVLVGDEVEQRPGAHEDHRLADGAALGLERHLGAAHGEDAGQGPAGEGNHPVHGAGGENQRIEGDAADALRPEGLGDAPPRRSRPACRGDSRCSRAPPRAQRARPRPCAPRSRRAPTPGGENPSGGWR